MSSQNLDFNQIYIKFWPKIHRFLLGMVGQYEAEDLTQEVFIRVNRGLATFRGESELSTWIYRIATNAALDRLRNPSFRRLDYDCGTTPTDADVEIETEDSVHDSIETVPQVEHQVYQKEMQECLLRFVNSLPEAYRTVLVLSEFENLDNKSIAEILGVTLNTVKIRLHRAREKLKVILAENCGPEWVEGNEFVPELKRTYLK